MIFHFIETHVAFVGIVFPGIAYCYLIRNRTGIGPQNQSTQRRRPLQPVSQHLEFHCAFIRIFLVGRSHWLVGDVMCICKTHTGERNIVELEIAVLISHAVRVLQHFFQFQPNGLATQSIRRNTLHPDLSNQAQAA